MCERDDCSSLRVRKAGETIICAYLIQLTPPTLQDHNGTFVLNCPLPAGSIIEKGDLFLFHLFVDSATGQITCNRATPIPRVLYCVYQKVLDDYRHSRNISMK